MDIEDFHNFKIDLVTPKPFRFEENQDGMKNYIQDFLKYDLSKEENIALARKELAKKHHLTPSNSNLLYTYKNMISKGSISPNLDFEKTIKGRSYREKSGVMVITVVTSPKPNGQSFSCKYSCHYCPNEPAHAGNNFQEQPRSYIFNEPGVRRANRNFFDAILQIRDRAKTYITNGMVVDKIEIIILGGTFHSYPKEYRETFIRDLFYAVNTLWDSGTPREKFSVTKEREINETSKSRIIGLTIETRPDQINRSSLIELRYLGVTRVQLGVQHTDDFILKKINRQCKTRNAIQAIKFLKDNCFKVDIHLMPDLPGSSYEKDLDMFNYILESEDLQADQWKIYPCMTIPWTEISKWYEEGTYSPYAETIQNGKNPLVELLIEVKSKVHPWIRLNRIIRDIPDDYMVNLDEVKEGMDIAAFSNARQLIQEMMKKRGLECKCIRCREVKGKNVTRKEVEEAKLMIREYQASGGMEYFLSYEDDKSLYGFLRLRLSEEAGICKNKTIFPELEDSALIRELHVYGRVVGVNQDKEDKIQHSGFGLKLLKRAEEISLEKGYRKISVIAGDGVKEYYRKKMGYQNEGSFLTKILI